MDTFYYLIQNTLPSGKYGHKMKQKFQRRRSKNNAVKTIQHTAVAHKNAPIILNTKFPFDIGKDQIAELGNHA